VKSLVKKYGALILLIIAATPLFYTLAFRVQQLAIHRKMKKNLECQLLHTITVSEKDVHWMADGKEIVINGELFDIRSSVLENGQYSFTGLFDKEETALINQLEKTQQQSSASDNKVILQLFQWLQTFYSDSPQTINLSFTDKREENLFIAPVPAKQYLGIIIPPPKAC
jgi:hypothetical protein